MPEIASVAEVKSITTKSSHEIEFTGCVAELKLLGVVGTSRSTRNGPTDTGLPQLPHLSTARMLKCFPAELLGRISKTLVTAPMSLVAPGTPGPPELVKMP